MKAKPSLGIHSNPKAKLCRAKIAWCRTGPLQNPRKRSAVIFCSTLPGLTTLWQLHKNALDYRTVCKSKSGRLQPNVRSRVNSNAKRNSRTYKPSNTETFHGSYVDGFVIPLPKKT